MPRNEPLELGRELVAASAVPLVLSILAEGESYGYAILKRVEQLSKGELSWSEGMLYPVLHRLEREGLIAARWSESEAGRKRKYYRLLPAGRKRLQQERRGWTAVNSALGLLWGSARG